MKSSELFVFAIPILIVHVLFRAISIHVTTIVLFFYLLILFVKFILGMNWDLGKKFSSVSSLFNFLKLSGNLKNVAQLRFFNTKFLMRIYGICLSSCSGEHLLSLQQQDLPTFNISSKSNQK